ncbi:hypothetical protein PtrM4_009960 [Pyrenophora tritici-repentis]|uniref:Uncharacterized protein n=1 Tax=Pyrenophora tritici-repentis TaxID=45151 RepID=A0A834VU01_9PLEO|nr:hypothetical protein PtrM4_009960 [Pyrenophora tritici-repentis]
MPSAAQIMEVALAFACAVVSSPVELGKPRNYLGQSNHDVLREPYEVWR